MIPRINVIIVQNGEMTRHTFKLPEVNVENFSQPQHWNVHFNWGDELTESESVQNMIRVFTTVELSDEERKLLISQGKMGEFKP